MAKEPHPCEIYFDPLIKHLDAIRTSGIREIAASLYLRPGTEHPAIAALDYLAGFASTRDAAAFRHWLDLNMSAGISDRVFDRLDNVGRTIRTTTAICQEWKCADDFGTDAAKEYWLPKLRQLEFDWDSFRDDVTDLQTYLIRLTEFIHNKLFVLSDLQKLILDALDGVAMTADELERAIRVARSTLYGGKNKRGGLKELVQRDRVRNDRKIGGYYRPDKKPQKSN